MTPPSTYRARVFWSWFKLNFVSLFDEDVLLNYFSSMRARSCNIDIGPDIGNCWVHDVCSTLRENRKAKQSSRTFSLIFILWRNGDVFILKKSRDLHFLPFSKELYLLMLCNLNQSCMQLVPQTMWQLPFKDQKPQMKGGTIWFLKALSWLYKNVFFSW